MAAVFESEERAHVTALVALALGEHERQRLATVLCTHVHPRRESPMAAAGCLILLAADGTSRVLMGAYDGTIHVVHAIVELRGVVDAMCSGASAHAHTPAASKADAVLPDHIAPSRQPPTITISGTSYHAVRCIAICKAAQGAKVGFEDP
jgi:hypothetical protein